MKRLIFRELLLQSALDLRARRIKFHRNLTIVKGPNGAGKSSLLGSLYRCFGAEPAWVDKRWRSGEVCSVLSVELDGEPLRVLHASGINAVFDGANRLLKILDGTAFETAEYWAKALGLHAPSLATSVGTLFSPFYMDQNASWQHPLAGFKNSGEFRGSAELAEFAIGARNVTYFETRARLNSTVLEKESVKNLEAGLTRVRKDFADKYGLLAFDLNFDRYKVEIDDLVRRMNVCKQQDESYSARFNALSSRKRDLEIQLAIAEEASSELTKDYEYASRLSNTSDGKECVVCPMCNASYDNTFRERFSIAQDSDACTAISLRVRNELKRVQGDLENLTTNYHRNAQDLGDIQELLNKRRGGLEIGEWLERRGRVELQDILEQRAKECAKRVVVLEKSAEQIREQLDASDISPLRKRVLARFSEIMKDHANQLAVQYDASRRCRSLDFPFRGAERTGGSSLPRALLAYQFAILKLMDEFSGSAPCPIVIDSPNQQDQDSESLDRIFAFLQGFQSKSSQVIIAFANVSDTQFSGDVVHLEGFRALLRPEEYVDVAAEVRPLLAQVPVTRMLW